MANSALDSSHADLVLLSQNLARSKRITDRMTSLLTSFDERLAKLERGVSTVHRSTGGYTRAQRNIQAALSQIDIVLSHHDLVNREDTAIQRGPSSSNIEPYKASIDRLVTAKRKGTGKEESVRMQKLIDTGARKLSTTALSWVKDNTEPGVVNLSPSVINQIASVLAYIRALPNISPTVETDMQAAYGDVRGKNLALSLDSFWNMDINERDFNKILDVMLAGFKAEHSLLRHIFSLSPPPTIPPAFRNIIIPSLSVFSEMGQTVNNAVKKNILDNAHVAFSAYSSLQNHVPPFEEWARAKPQRKENDLGELIHVFRGSCLRSFPEFIEYTKSYGTRLSPNDGKPGMIAPITVQNMRFMKHLCLHSEVSESLLSTLGDGKWDSGSGARTLAFGTGNTLLSKYLIDLLNSLILALENRQKLTPRIKPGALAIFKLNNITYIRQEILNDSISDWMGEEECENELNRRNRIARTNYLEIFQPLVSCLVDEDGGSGGSNGIGGNTGVVGGAIKAVTSGGAGGERRDVKDRFIKFSDALEEAESVHRLAHLDMDESAETRDRLRDEVRRMVIPTYQKFWNKHRKGEFSKHPEKYLKLDADEAQRRLDMLFT